MTPRGFPSSALKILSTSVLWQALGLICLGGLFSLVYYNFIASPPEPDLASIPPSSGLPQNADVQSFLQLSEKDPQLIGEPDAWAYGGEEADAFPTLEESFSGEEMHDLLFISNILGDMTEKVPSREDLTAYITAKGFTPYEERRGHERSGFRRVISVREIEDEQRLVKEFYGSYLEFEDEYVFDRLYYGLQPKELVFEHLVKEIDTHLQGKFIRRIIKEKYARWDFSDGSFVFINGEYNGRGKEMVLVGKEWEIH